MRRTCRRVILRTGEIETEVHYGITSLGRDLAGPRELEFFWRGRWTIENRDHYVRDEPWVKIARRRIPVMHPGSWPRSATVSSPCCVIPRMGDYRGWSNIAALHHYGASPQKALLLIYRMECNVKKP